MAGDADSPGGARAAEPVADATRPRDPVVTPLADLASWLGALEPDLRTVDDLGVAVTGVTLSSQRVRPGDLYAALPGARAHGIDFADAAVAVGAVAVLTDPAGAARAPGDVPLLVVPSPRAVLGRLAAKVYGEPATAMVMIGVTGTQGKTTTTRLAEDGLLRAGTRAAVIGTVGTRICGAEVRTALTTPEAPDLHGLFATMREDDVEVCAMEVSSHALVLGRVDGVVFDVAVFLNLGRDHLDFHTDLEDYFAAKAALFTPERARRALVCVDDEYGVRLADLAAGRGLPVRTFSAQDAGTGVEADWTVAGVDLAPDRSTFTVRTPTGGTVAAGCPIPGAFNVTNTLAAIAACAEAGLDAAAVAAGISAGGGVPGRLELVGSGADRPTVVVDYAHKPDAVAAVLQTLRPLTDARLIVVLGAGGDRDTGKRPVMGEIAARLADVLVVTDDNPRTEDPAAIRAAVLAGAEEGRGRSPAGRRTEVLEVGDRRAAIAAALDRAEPGDIVLVAGKGHETGQEIQGVVHPFDDREVTRELLAAYPLTRRGGSDS